MVNTIKNVKITITAMYSTQSPPFSRESKQPPPFPYQTIISNVFLVFKWAVLRKKFVCRIHFTVILRHYNMGVK
jgi:hypothetical protein